MTTTSTADQRHYPHGVPCWIDLEPTDLDAAQHFYAGLFGWDFHDAMPAGAPGSYLIAQLDGRDVAALASDDRDRGWTTYIACDDADASAAAVATAGGTVVSGPEDAGPGGRLARVVDPTGARFRLWQARRRLGAQVVNEANTWNFSHLVTGDRERALAFYNAVFGWVIDPEQGAGMIRVPGYGDHLAATVDPDIHVRQEFAPPGFADVVAGLEERPGAGQFSVRFAVADRDASAAHVERLSGRVLSSADNEWSRDALVADPEGHEFVVSQFAPTG